VKKHVVTKPSDTSAAKNSTVDQELSNTVVEHKCSADGGDSSEGVDEFYKGLTVLEYVCRLVVL
ncbi:hypothetical protein Tco_1399079, partial [Tanacetum coccineum]